MEPPTASLRPNTCWRITARCTTKPSRSSEKSSAANSACPFRRSPAENHAAILSGAGCRIHRSGSGHNGFSSEKRRPSQAFQRDSGPGLRFTFRSVRESSRLHQCAPIVTAIVPGAAIPVMAAGCGDYRCERRSGRGVRQKHSRLVACSRLVDCDDCDLYHERGPVPMRVAGQHSAVVSQQHPHRIDRRHIVGIGKRHRQYLDDHSHGQVVAGFQLAVLRCRPIGAVVAPRCGTRRALPATIENMENHSSRADSVWADIERIRAEAPVIHNITNYVVMNTTANALLAIGASPVMAHAEEEVEEMTAIARSLVINIGTLSAPWIAAMFKAGEAARRNARPMILDPVGAGATTFRTATARQLLAELSPAIVRGNASEIRALADDERSTRGVDSAYQSEDAAQAADRLSARYGW